MSELPWLHSLVKHNAAAKHGSSKPLTSNELWLLELQIKNTRKLASISDALWDMWKSSIRVQLAVCVLEGGCEDTNEDRTAQNCIDTQHPWTSMVSKYTYTINKDIFACFINLFSLYTSQCYKPMPRCVIYQYTYTINKDIFACFINLFSLYTSQCYEP